MAELYNVQDEPWQRVMHGYSECCCIFVVLCFEMRWLTWFRKKAKEDFSQPGTLYVIAKYVY